MNRWQADLVRAARDAKCEFGSVDVIANEAHGRTVIALLRAFEQDASCSMFAEARTPERALYENARPADILILHPDLGVLFVEVKGWTLGEITRVNAGTVHRDVNGYQEMKDPWKQAGDAAGQLQKATIKALRRRKLSESEVPYFHWLVAFPNIRRTGWLAKGYGATLNPDEFLFAEDLEDSQQLKATLMQRSKARAGYRLPCSHVRLDHVRFALGDSAVINRRKRPQASREGTLSQLIDITEWTRQRFTPEQQMLIEAEFDGRPQLVRGVAGSGKTAVLIGNLVNMLDRKRNGGQLRLDGDAHERFLVVCFNQSLVPLLRRQFEDAFRELTRCAPPECVTITYMNGLQYAMSHLSGGPLQYQFWKNHKDKPGQTRAQQFASSYCLQLDALAHAGSPVLDNLQYDAIYVDEGQDLFEEEYQLLMKLLRADPKTGEKNIVIFYDDAQNLYGRPRPTWADLGIEIRGRSALMKTCLRNPRQIVEFAFNLLLGTASETRVMTRQFAETRLLTQESLVEELPDRWLVHFAKRQDGRIPEVALAANRQSEADWILFTLKKLIREEGVRPDDILLVAEKPSMFLPTLEERIIREFPEIGRLLKPWGDSSNPDKKVHILQKGALTLSTVQASKGYDCPVVMLIGADLFPTGVEGRAAFYVGATRARMRLFVSGLRSAGSLAEEAEAVAARLARSPEAVTMQVAE